MKRKIFLDLEEDEPINVGLIRLAKNIPNHELFFEINKKNSFKFARVNDVLYKRFSFPKYETYLPETKTCYQIITNKSSPIKKKTHNELFAQAEEVKYLMPKNKDVDYIIYAKDSFPEFSLILLPENILFHIQDFSISPNNELYKLIQYYE